MPDIVYRILFSFGRTKKNLPIRKNILRLGKLIVLDILIVLTMDLVMDPVFVHFGNWR